MPFLNPFQLAAGFTSRKQQKVKQPKERKYGIAVSDEKMIKLTTKEDSKEAEQQRVQVS
jgi:hypothetical protein